MITLLMAIQKVRDYFEEAKSRDPYDNDIVILEEETIEFEYGWVFFYQSREFVETGDIFSALGGNAPIIVNKNDGSLHITGTALPVEKYIEDYIASMDKR